MAIQNNEKYNARDYIFIVCKQARYIKPLRMSGPIFAPLKVRMDVAWQIICSGITLYQYNPPTKEFALMTLQNAWYKTKFKQTVSNTPSLMTAQESTTAATMSLRSTADPVTNENEEDDEVTEVKTSNTPNNSSNNSGKKKKKNKQNQTQTQQKADESKDEKVETPVEDTTDNEPVVTEDQVEAKDDKAE